MAVLLEACVTSVPAANNAVALGVDRVELCENLSVGGLSPSRAMIEEASKKRLPLRVMLRPRAGNFCYNANEVAQMEDTLACVVDCGITAAVCGALDAAGDLDEAVMARLAEKHVEVNFTFHRAIDEASDPVACSQKLSRWPNFDRLLVAGQGFDTKARWESVRSLKTTASQVVVGCGGIRPANFADFVAATEVSEVHFNAMSATGELDSRLVRSMVKLAQA